ncbi:carboxymuconolactone decarboxylase family protein [Frankia sp. AgB1.9]|uniref:carboxymuconolactone decarboxylase family protein n=1 Tax=unclassified Frankia TaxID=2632575 RepID=UPI0019312569|nr:MULTISPECIES: carboxymuconolactone decarboxylase family protein [unclassified Frankia]MBL7488363.1 carboxymuconolactone decarboxylase family protein [Frankia sp. AgW1.1]MBL7547689.1 carboxymuconolactone decarboxylase family protein [Frankia sp. AgB1.9]MBL7624066.1 carboxymuconolactone decarboxylase family protein [Frankia sp. AgB1.8]
MTGTNALTGAPAARIGPLPAAEWDEADRELLRGHLARAERYLSGAPDAPPMPPVLGLLARHARIGGPWLAFSGRLLEDGALRPRDRELLILRVGVRTRSRYLWAEHVRLGREAGLDEAELAALGVGAEADGWSGRDRDLLVAVDQLVDQHVLDDVLWARLAGELDERELLELIFVVGSYVCLAMVLNSAGLAPPADSPPVPWTDPAARPTGLDAT